MESIMQLIIPTIPGAAWSVIVLVLGGLYIYRKIDADRKVTKGERDKDSQDLHDKLMKHDWEIGQIKADNSHRDILLDDLRKQVEAVNQNLAIVATKLDSLVEAVKEHKR
jgi:hypothetical protein